MQKERFYRELVLALPDKANADGWDDAAYFAAKVKKLNESEELMRLGLHFSLPSFSRPASRVRNSGARRSIFPIPYRHLFVSFLAA